MKHFLQCIFNLIRLRHSALSGRAAGKIAAAAFQNMHAVLFALFQIVLCDRVFQHGGIHCRYDQFLAPARKEGCGKHVIRNAVGNLCDDIRGRRRNDKGIRLLGETDMVHIRRIVRCEHIQDHLLTGQTLHGQRGDEFLRFPGHQYMHFIILLVQR